MGHVVQKWLKRHRRTLKYVCCLLLLTGKKKKKKSPGSLCNNCVKVTYSIDKINLAKNMLRFTTTCAFNRTSEAQTDAIISLCRNYYK